MLRSIGEWVNAYQRVTHYFRALDIWQPPPHLLALAVLERALTKAGGDQHPPPLRLAMDEVHTLLGQQVPVTEGAPGAGLDLRGSVSWRICSLFARGAGRDALPDAREIDRLRPVPDDVPGPMVPQPLEASVFARASRAVTTGIRLRLGNGWRRRHA
jgi:hypothetical protein